MVEEVTESSWETDWEIPSFRDLSSEKYRNFELLMAKLMVNAPWSLECSLFRRKIESFLLSDLQRPFLVLWYCRFRFLSSSSRLEISGWSCFSVTLGILLRWSLRPDKIIGKHICWGVDAVRYFNLWFRNRQKHCYGVEAVYVGLENRLLNSHCQRIFQGIDVREQIFHVFYLAEQYRWNLSRDNPNIQIFLSFY